MHIMLDIETLSTDPHAVVLSIGAVAFSVQDGLAPIQFYGVASLDDQSGRTINPDTVSWWMQQVRENPDAGDVFDGPREPVSSVIERLTQFITRFLTPDGGVWANGPDFDCVILRTLYEELGIKLPWRHSQHRCVRTMKSLARSLNMEVVVAENMCAHNALADAEYQARYIIALLRDFGVQA